MKNKIIEILKNALEIKFEGRADKQHIEVFDNRVNCSCFYCGDSQKKSNKKRGNLYLDTLYYKCFNCGKFCRIDKIVKDFDIDISLLEGISLINIEHNKIEKPSELSVFKDYLILDRDSFKKEYGLIEAEHSKYIKDYLDSRGIDEVNYHRFLTKPSDNSLYIPNIMVLDGIEYVISFNRRIFSDNSRYIISNYKEIAKRLGYEFDTENEIYKQFLKLSTYYNIFNVNLSEIVYILEGEIDSMFIPNAIATSGVTKEFNLNLAFKYFIFDNDDAGNKKFMDMIDKNEYVFYWRGFINDYGLERYNIKDINDLYLILKSKNKDLSELDNYFVNNILNLT